MTTIKKNNKARYTSQARDAHIKMKHIKLTDTC